jgi:hypothetical protein
LGESDCIKFVADVLNIKWFSKTLIIICVFLTLFGSSKIFQRPCEDSIFFG